MSQLTAAQFKALYGSSGTTFPDNTTGQISESDMRQFGEDIADSSITQQFKYYNIIESNNTKFENTGAGPDTLYEYEVPNGSLSAAGDHVEVVMFGIFTDESPDKNIKLFWGNQEIVSIDENNAVEVPWFITLDIVYISNSVQKLFLKYGIGASLTTSALNNTRYISGSQDTTSGVDLTLQYEVNSSTDDVLSLDFVKITTHKA